jgi:hypothetical protein
MTRLLDRPLAAALWLAIFGAAASAQGVADVERRAPAAQRALVEARITNAGKSDGAASASTATDPPRYADAPKRAPHANARSGRGSK